MTAEHGTLARIQEAEEAREALGAALRRAGIQLPAMDVRPVARADGRGYGLVSLGDCAAAVAHQLAAVIEKGAAR
ncbi:hypothetical protein [Streptomyces alkaliterrae]|uniref:Uncharacterized protein n=1 Tax=Streptomyces alkaliterrae TaxID=2213162 RepID=A0A5P0YUC4_9ACTN|nr:hypothetical protein [Streptomyces alkaliterrae]MBB1259675.1 hypothetical protein [Streptomyces alkaliterrae]MQS03911.1 hypothetical protein [Streptomyces alkaliterrae]